MKLIFISSLASFSSLLGLSTAHTLRATSSSRSSNTTTVAATTNSIRRRSLEGNNSAVPLSADGSLLNELIKLALPAINAGIQQFTPDPLDLNIAGTYDLGTYNFGCGATGLSFSYNWGGISGVSDFFIESLEVIPGTETVSAGGLNSDWSGTFTMAVASLAEFVVDDLGAGLQGTACGVSYQQSVGGNVITSQPALGGAVDLAGSICNGLLSIDTASILNSLSMDYSSINAILTGVPSGFGSYVSAATNELSVLLKDDLIRTVEPTVRPIIERQIVESSATFAPRQIIPINAGFVRNAAARRIRNTYNAMTTTQFFSFVSGVFGVDADGGGV